MSFARTGTVTLTTNGSGAATGYIAPDDGTGVFNGPINLVAYTKVDFVDASVMTITTETTLQNVWVQTGVNASATVAPRQATHSTVGAASLYDTTDNEPVEDVILAVNERLKIVIASGGDTKTGTYRAIVGP